MRKFPFHAGFEFRASVICHVYRIGQEFQIILYCFRRRQNKFFIILKWKYEDNCFYFLL